MGEGCSRMDQGVPMCGILGASSTPPSGYCSGSAMNKAAQILADDSRAISPKCDAHLLMDNNHLRPTRIGVSGRLFWKNLHVWDSL
jgi:hypothetical protein